nr:MAG TPA: hypothetical protein [Caudoviricetes sp.]
MVGVQNSWYLAYSSKGVLVSLPSYSISTPTTASRLSLTS